jgi:hypothetical protein
MLIFGLILTGSSFSGSGQKDTQEADLKHEVVVTLKLIQVYVTDKKGSPVTDLEKSDFQLWDNGKPVEITGFEKHVSTLPPEVGQDAKSFTSKGSLSFNIHKQFWQQNALVFFVEFQTTDLPDEGFALHLFADEPELGSKSHTTATFQVR